MDESFRTPDAYFTSKDKHCEPAAVYKRLDDCATEFSRTSGNCNDGGHDVVLLRYSCDVWCSLCGMWTTGRRGNLVRYEVGSFTPELLTYAILALHIAGSLFGLYHTVSSKPVAVRRTWGYYK